MKELIKAMNGNSIYKFKIERTSLVDEVSDSLLELITNESLAIGDKLPSEAKLSEIFSVSKLTIRLALQKLSGLGVVETKNGEGSFVTPFSIERYLDEASEVVYEEGMLDDVQVFRRIIEVSAGHLAIDTASDKQINELIECAIRMEKATYEETISEEENFDYYATLDYNFHLKLCEISNNKLMYLAFLSCKVAIKKYLVTILRARSKKNANKKILSFPDNSHVKLGNAIKKRDIEEFNRIYYKMVDINDALEKEVY